MAYTLVKRIKKTGFPVFTKSGRVSTKWKKSHQAANRAEKKRFGKRAFKALNKVKLPKDELYGSHTKSGKILISSRIPKKFRGQVAYHEKVESRLMRKKVKK